jgi:excisionase family DNA binding protein
MTTDGVTAMKLYSIGTVARLLDVSPGYVRGLIKAGELATVRLPRPGQQSAERGRVRISEADFDAWQQYRLGIKAGKAPVTRLSRRAEREENCARARAGLPPLPTRPCSPPPSPEA